MVIYSQPGDVEKSERKRLLERPGRTLEDNIELTFEQLDGPADWINLTQDRDMWRGLAKSEKNIWVP